MFVIRTICFQCLVCLVLHSKLRKCSSQPQDSGQIVEIWPRWWHRGTRLPYYFNQQTLVRIPVKEKNESLLENCRSRTQHYFSYKCLA